ncbi:hypothetical protein Desfe_0160 [Desulfurococcus amylolyticus DSM 16532]|uniref:Uncharacterized protein n=1 Tax=Desulfurococcus amylolyticus DSM 16532 TaxID=768672 RepID=I3XQ47_DESAM|nr:hypothetical protein Desfe_0160 [Desulfurococcus amylolyticus DSM 16532]
MECFIQELVINLLPSKYFIFPIAGIFPALKDKALSGKQHMKTIDIRNQVSRIKSVTEYAGKYYERGNRYIY